MKLSVNSLLLICEGAILIGAGANAQSLLSAQSFPKTFEDLPFVDRIEVLREGYEEYESEYEEINGQIVCVKNCAYAGITLQEDNMLIEKDTAASLVQSALYESAQQGYMFASGENNAVYHPTPTAQPTTHPVQAQPINQQMQHISGGGQNVGGSHYYCQNQRVDIPAHQAIPRGEPVANHPRISSPYGNRVHPVTHKPQLHKGIDYAVPSGTVVYTTADGVVENVWTDSGCGNGLKIEHVTGIRTVYCHLDHATVKRGDRVFAGCPVAVSDNTGRSTGSHLHYGMKNASGGYLNPSQYTGRTN